MTDADPLMVQYVIYSHPSDYPDSFVVRAHKIYRNGSIVSEQEPLSVVATLEEARASLPTGLICLARSPGDEPQISEVWI